MTLIGILQALAITSWIGGGCWIVNKILPSPFKD